MRIVLKTTTESDAWEAPDPASWLTHAAAAERAGDHLLALVWRARRRAWEAWSVVALRAARALVSGASGAALADALTHAATGAAMARDALLGRRFAACGIKVEYDYEGDLEIERESVRPLPGCKEVD